MLGNLTQHNVKIHLILTSDVWNYKQNSQSKFHSEFLQIGLKYWTDLMLENFKRTLQFWDNFLGKPI